MIVEKIITSVQHSEVKMVKSLSRRKERRELGLFVIEGIRLVEDSLQTGAPLHKIYYTTEFSATERARKLLKNVQVSGLPAQEVSAVVMSKMADTEQPQGILATVKMLSPDIAKLTAPQLLIVVCDKIQDPGNLGTIIRTADAAGVHAIFTTPGTVDVFNPKVLRSTMGSVFHLPIFTDWNAADILACFQQLGVTPIGTALDAKKWYFDEAYNRSMAIWLGSEASGIEIDVLEKIPEQVKIPMPGQAESLNVAIAASVVMYEVVRQRMAE